MKHAYSAEGRDAIYETCIAMRAVQLTATAEPERDIPTTYSQKTSCVQIRNRSILLTWFHFSSSMASRNGKQRAIIHSTASKATRLRLPRAIHSSCRRAATEQHAIATGGRAGPPSLLPPNKQRAIFNCQHGNTIAIATGDSFLVRLPRAGGRARHHRLIAAIP